MMIKMTRRITRRISNLNTLPVKTVLNAVYVKRFLNLSQRNSLAKEVQSSGHKLHALFHFRKVVNLSK